LGFSWKMLGQTYTTGGKVTGHPLGVTVTLLLVGEHGLVGVTTPEREDTLVLGSALEALGDTVVLAVETAGLEHLILEVGVSNVSMAC
jgi:hypothetical protein